MAVGYRQKRAAARGVGIQLRHGRIRAQREPSRHNVSRRRCSCACVHDPGALASALTTNRRPCTMHPVPWRAHREWRTESCSVVMARWASLAFANVTRPQPLERPSAPCMNSRQANQVKSSQVKPSQAKSNQVKSSQARPKTKSRGGHSGEESPVLDLTWIACITSACSTSPAVRKWSLRSCGHAKLSQVKSS